MFETMVEEAKCESELALTWAINAKNAFQNNSGFSPDQVPLDKPIILQF